MAERMSARLKKRRDRFVKEEEEEEKRAKRERHGTPERSGRCVREFYDRPCEELARALLGCVLVRECSGDVCKGVVVETEAYLGAEDRAAHSYRGKRTERNSAMFMSPGTAYVYTIYGMHKCFNISSRGEGAAVLIRALDPVEGMASMERRRGGGKRPHQLCNGPAKLCQAMAIDGSCNKVDLVTSSELWVEQSESGRPEERDMVVSSRIGVDYAGEWAGKPLRYYMRGNVCVSKR